MIQGGVAFSLRSRDYKDAQCVCADEPTCYNGVQITNPINASNPAPGTCHTLVNDGRNYVVENHPNDSRVKIREDNVFQTLSSRMGTGGE